MKIFFLRIFDILCVQWRSKSANHELVCRILIYRHQLVTSLNNFTTHRKYCYWLGYRSGWRQTPSTNGEREKLMLWHKDINDYVSCIKIKIYHLPTAIKTQQLVFNNSWFSDRLSGRLDSQADVGLFQHILYDINCKPKLREIQKHDSNIALRCSVLMGPRLIDFKSESQWKNKQSKRYRMTKNIITDNTHVK